MKNNLWYDVLTVWRHSLRLLLKSKETLIVFVFGFVLLILMLYFMEDAKEEKSVVYIGMADEDQSELSRKLLLNTKENEVFSVTEGTLKELLIKLQKGELSAVFLIKEGYETSVNNGKTGNMITLYEAKGKQLPFMGDILAGEMMFDICTAKGFLEYKKVMEETARTSMMQVEYSDYVTTKLNQEEFDFAFNISYLSTEGQQEKEPENTAIYQQLIFAIEAFMLGLLAIYAVMPYYNLCHGKVVKRNVLLPVSSFVWTLSSALAAMVVELLFGLSFLLIFIYKNHGTVAEFLSMFLCTVGFCGGIVIVTMLVACWCNSFTVYQLGMLFIVVLFGIIGILSIFDGLLWKSDWLRLVPNYWYVQQMMKLI